MTGDSGDAVLDLLRGHATAAGRNAADWWAQDAIGGRATGDVRAAARRILAGIDDGDPAVLDALPTAPDDDAVAAGYGEVAPDDAPTWRRLGGPDREHLLQVWRDSFDQAVVDRVGELCRAAASPTGDGRDLSHLHPDQVSIGHAGVFAGDWAWTPAADGQLRIPVGFAGTLIDHWNGWAVFTCTREVAEAIVADQTHQRAAHRAFLASCGIAGADLDQQVDQALPTLSFDGDVIVADERGISDDPHAIQYIHPDGEGRYVVMGWSWTWQPVDPYDCDTIAGQLPAPEAAQQFVVPVHCPGWRWPHDRFTITDLHTDSHGGHGGAGPVAATLRLDGAPAATITSTGTAWTITHTLLDFQQEWDGFVAGCRHHDHRVDAAAVLAALVTENSVTAVLTAAQAAGGTLARLLDTDGRLLLLHPAPRPHDGGHAALRNLGRDLAAAHPTPVGAQWEIWTGTGWYPLPPGQEGRPRG